MICGICDISKDKDQRKFYLVVDILQNRSCGNTRARLLYGSNQLELSSCFSLYWGMLIPVCSILARCTPLG